MRTFPVFLDVTRIAPMVVGGGTLAEAKVRTLLARAPRVVVSAPQITAELHELCLRGVVEWVQREPKRRDLRHRPLVVCATEDFDQDRRIARRARAAGAPVNIPDKPDQSSFAFGAMVNRGDVAVAIGTDGAAPVLAAMLRAWLEQELHPRFGRLAALARTYRPRVARLLPPGGARRRFWTNLFSGAPAAKILEGDETCARNLIDAELAGAERPPQAGRIILVGAGPGDPDLLTLKAVRAIKSADVILYDRLVGGDILDHARREAELVDVGKRAGQPSTPQATIDQRLVDEARAGKIVVRLKGGDAMIFGRALEELNAAEAAGIETEVIPGITAAQAASAALALPLTARGTVRQFSVVTGSGRDGLPDLDWAALAQPGQAIAVYMGTGNAPELRRRLLAAGADYRTPIVIVENASLPDQHAIATNLETLTTAIEATATGNPTLIIVGLDWHEMGLARPDWVETFLPNNSHFEFPRPAAVTGASSPDALAPAH